MAKNIIESIPCKLDVDVDFGKDGYHSVVFNFKKDGAFREAALEAIKTFFVDEVGKKRKDKFNVSIEGMIPVYKDNQGDMIGITCNMVVLFCAIDCIDETLPILKYQMINADGNLIQNDYKMSAIEITSKLVVVAFEKVELKPFTIKEANNVRKFFEQKIQDAGMNEFSCTNYQIFEGFKNICISYRVELNDLSVQEEIKEIIADRETITNLKENVKKGIQGALGNKLFFFFFFFLFFVYITLLFESGKIAPEPRAGIDMNTAIRLRLFCLFKEISVRFHTPSR